MARSQARSWHADSDENRIVDWSKVLPSAIGPHVTRDETGEMRVVEVIRSMGDLRISVPGYPGDATVESLILLATEWRGPLEEPSVWMADVPRAPGWYWIQRPGRGAAVVRLFRPWGEALIMWVSEPGKTDKPLRRVGFGDCQWAGPLELLAPGRRSPQAAQARW